MQENYKEIVQAVLDGKQLQCLNSLYGVFEDYFGNNIPKDVIPFIIQSIKDNPELVLRVKPEKKVHKYQTRAYMGKDGEVVVWTSTGSFTQEYIENFINFYYWIESAQDREVVYE